MGQKILGGVGTHIVFFNGKKDMILCISGKKYMILCILKGILPCKMHKILFFPENLIKILGFTSKCRWGRVTLNTGVFYLA